MTGMQTRASSGHRGQRFSSSGGVLRREWRCVIPVGGSLRIGGSQGGPHREKGPHRRDQQSLEPHPQG